MPCRSQLAVVRHSGDAVALPSRIASKLAPTNGAVSASRVIVQQVTGTEPLKAMMDGRFTGRLI
jgi:hypothetical protein